MPSNRPFWTNCIVGSIADVQAEHYSVYTIKDITPVYSSIAAMVWRFVAICAACIVAGTALIILLVHRTAKPLIKLKKATRRIAVGEHGERVEINTNDEVGELAADFNTMTDAVQSHIAELEDTAQRRQLFIGGLTHEFKTPITSLMIHTDTLLFADLSEEETRQSLLHINKQCRWLERLTKKLLHLITLGEDIKIRTEPVPALLSDVAQSISETLSERGTPLAMECETEILCMDADLIKSLLINLIDNASKASQAGQTVTLRAYANTLEVSDNGRGIPEKEIASITDAFYMVNRSRSKKHGGSGLGLALVKQIADAHKAELCIESTAGGGTTVRVLFPDNKTLMS